MRDAPDRHGGAVPILVYLGGGPDPLGDRRELRAPDGSVLLLDGRVLELFAPGDAGGGSRRWHVAQLDVQAERDAAASRVRLRPRDGGVGTELALPADAWSAVTAFVQAVARAR
jgi:hypothetical protein